MMLLNSDIVNVLLCLKLTKPNYCQRLQNKPYFLIINKASLETDVGLFFALIPHHRLSMQDISDRLDRIDVKLDKLSEAVSQLARIEERIAHQTEGMSQLDSRLNDMETRIRSLELQSSSRGIIIAHIERFGWILVTALVGVGAYLLKE